MRIIIWIILGWVCPAVPLVAQPAQPFAEEIRAFRIADSLHEPKTGSILFIGSSSFRLWKNIEADFPGFDIINRGFGGSSLADLMIYAKDIIFPYRPRQIVIYCGENDLAASDTVTADKVIRRFEKLLTMIRYHQPGVPIVYVSIKPSPSREKLLGKIQEANKGIRRFLRHTKHSRFVDVYQEMVDKEGRIRSELFIEDRLHMNRQGYEIWKKAITPYLLKD